MKLMLSWKARSML